MAAKEPQDAASPLLPDHSSSFPLWLLPEPWLSGKGKSLCCQLQLCFAEWPWQASGKGEGEQQSGLGSLLFSLPLALGPLLLLCNQIMMAPVILGHMTSAGHKTWLAGAPAPAIMLCPFS